MQEVNKNLLCGHQQIGSCYMKEEDINCETLIVKKLEACEHEVEIKCKNRDNKISCKSKCTTRLDCGHACREWCDHNEIDPDHRAYKCNKTCNRKCRNGHECPKEHACFKRCPPCKVLLDIELPKCGHWKKLECHIDLQTYRGCGRPCERVLDCGDKCGNKCGEDCGPCVVPKHKVVPECSHISTFPCHKPPTREGCVTLVKPKNASTCKHETLVPCNVAEKLSSTDVQKYWCDAPCNYTFPTEDGGCEHKCKGTCRTCRNGSFHQKCNEACERILVCGHICEFPCANGCPPCSKRCGLKCEHSSCKKLCGQPCTECKEKCGWKCPHQQCQKLCGEICDREPCDEPCPRTLKCGHSCIGLCGETCPPLCRECDKEKLLEFQLLYTEDEPDSRFVWLPDCGHCIEVEGLTMHLNAKNTAAHEIDGVKKCPRCQTVIRSCRRFNYLLRTLMVDVHAVREKVFGDKKALKIKQNQLLTTLDACHWKETLPELHKMIVDYISESGYGHRRFLKRVGHHVLNSLQAIYQLGEAALTKIYPSDLHIRAIDLQKVQRLCAALFTEIMSRTLPLSAIEIRDGEREILRLIHYKELLRYAQRAERTTHWAFYTQIEDGLMAFFPYTGDEQAKFKKDLEALEEKCKTGLGISPLERLQIVRALGMSRGHWYKCPNGHIYAIGDCGRAMQVSKCNECGAAIGGTSHSLLRDNDSASEME